MILRRLCDTSKRVMSADQDHGDEVCPPVDMINQTPACPCPIIDMITKGCASCPELDMIKHLSIINVPFVHF